MKYLVNISVGIVALYVLSGCSVMETDVLEPNKEERVPLAVNNVGVSTKSIYTGIGTGTNELQRIGVVVTNSSGDYYDDTNQTQLFYYNGSTWGMKKDTLFLADRSGTVYTASVPSDSESFNVSLTAGMPVLSGTISASQTCTPPTDDTTQLSDVSQYDYLYGVEPGSASNRPSVSHKQNTVSLEMRHFLAKVSFRFMKANGQPVPDANDYVKKVILKSTDAPFFLAGGTYSFNLGNGEVSGSSSLSGELTFTTKTPPSDLRQVDVYTADYVGLAAKMFGLVAPVSEVKGTISVLLGAKENTTNDRIYLAEVSTFTWKSGNHYIYTLQVTDAGLQISKPQVVGWEETTYTKPIQPDGVTPN